MYKKKDKKVMVIAAIVVVLFIAFIYVVPHFSEIFRGKEPVAETESPEYEVLIHKTDAGKIEVNKHETMKVITCKTLNHYYVT